jgi:hypothetical protein
LNKAEYSFWTKPWSYSHGFILSFSLLLIGFLIEIFSGGISIVIPPWPLNIISFLILISIILILFFAFRKRKIIQWLGSIPAATASIVSFTIVILVMGFVPQSIESKNDITGITNILNSWMFVLTFLNLFITLCIVTLKRIFPFRLRNIGFLMNHAGLLVILVGGTLSVGDLQRVTMICHYNNPIWYGADENGKQVELPFALELNSFDIEYYNPELLIVNNQTGDIESSKKKTVIEQNQIIAIDTYTIYIDTFYHYSFKSANRYFPIENTGSTQSAHITVNSSNKLVAKGWISNGSFALQSDILNLNTSQFLAMASPKPKKFQSKFKLYTPDQKIDFFEIEVNRPFTTGDWTLYQTSYDEQKGKWSEYSVIEAVKDNWIKLIYIGIFMLFIGSIQLFWQGKKRNIKANVELV